MGSILEQLNEERQISYSGGLYHLTQIKLAYNSNRIEGSLLTEEQTRYMYETKTLIPTLDKTATPINDIVETQNHFTLFNYMLIHASKQLSEDMIKEFHRLLKSSSEDAQLDWFAVGDYKKQENEVGGKETAHPKEVSEKMKMLLEAYNQKQIVTLNDIVDFHYDIESIHPFQDGNGRVGRMIMFKECLKNGITPFIIEDVKKAFYYRGLKEYKSEPGYLIETCLDAQDNYKVYCDKFCRQDKSPDTMECYQAEIAKLKAERSASDAKSPHGENKIRTDQER